MTSASKLIGNILPGSTDVVPTRPRKSNGLGAAQAVAIRRHVGLTDILEWAGRGSLIDQDVRSCFSHDDADKILFIARSCPKNWLEQRLLAQIFDWFDCVDTTSVKTDAGMRRWTAEAVARDRLFLKLLGVTESCCN